jgi:dihydroflavonol-4-reductase
MNGKTILLTGISGFVAKHCAVELLRHGYAVRGTVRSLARADKVRTTLSAHCDVSALSFCAADLSSGAGWDDAAGGVYGVLHVASPYPISQPRDEQELIRPAVEGTLRVLKAAIAAGATRFVQTSSTVAIANGHPRERTMPFTESDWSVLDGPGVTAYTRSKTLAERAARELVATSRPALHFCTVNPGFVLGPLLDDESCTSGEVIRMFLQGKYPGSPKLSFPVVDVRDVATMHRLALETGSDSGGRYMAVSEAAWFRDMMLPIKAQLGDAARKVPKHELPNFLVRLVSLLDPSVRSVVPELGRHANFDNTLTRKSLGIGFIPVSESAPAMARSLVDLGMVSRAT